MPSVVAGRGVVDEPIIDKYMLVKRIDNLENVPVIRLGSVGCH
jgi:hypothetical protein